MNDLYKSLRNRRPPMVVKIQRKRHVTGPMAQPQQTNSSQSSETQA